jgi:tight adherence protein B
VLAIDRSKSMKGAPLDSAAAAASQFLRGKRQADRVSVVTFGSTALIQSRFAQSTIDADTTLRTLSTDAVEGTALYDSVVVATGELGSQTLPGRVLVLLTDGRDVRSLATFKEALASAHRSDVVVYAIALGDARHRPLEQLAKGTGGAFYSSATPAALASIYRKIGAELDRTWRISYTTAARPGEKIAITVGSKDGPGRTVAVPGRHAQPVRTLLPRSLVLGASSVALLLLVIAALIFLAVRQAQALPHSTRIKRLVRAHTDPRGGAASERGKRRRPSLQARLAALDARLRRLHRWERVERLVETAALPFSAAMVIVGALGLAILLPLVAAATVNPSPIVYVALFALGLMVPFVVIQTMATRRIHAFEAQLPDVLSTIAGSLRVGHGLKASLQGIAHDGAPPISTELRRVLSEERLGRPLEASLVSMCERLGSDDLLYVATAVDVQSQVGGSLAGVFSTVAETVRQRQQHRNKVRALTATGRASATVLTLFPVALVVLLLLISPEYMLPFLRSGVGQALMVYSVVSISIAALILRRITSVKG